jgi:hypothetical protein
MSQLASIVVGTGGLSVALLVALSLTLSRGAPSGTAIARLQTPAVVAVVSQAAHFGEEAASRFYVVFPETLGLAPWSATFFVPFNVAWLAVWIASIAMLSRHPRAAVLPLWFLAIASIANGIVHPLLALVAGAYFPGLWTSPLVGVVGIWLLRALFGATGRTR